MPLQYENVLTPPMQERTTEFIQSFLDLQWFLITGDAPGVRGSYRIIGCDASGLQWQERSGNRPKAGILHAALGSGLPRERGHRNAVTFYVFSGPGAFEDNRNALYTDGRGRSPAGKCSRRGCTLAEERRPSGPGPGGGLFRLAGPAPPPEIFSKTVIDKGHEPFQALSLGFALLRGDEIPVLGPELLHKLLELDLAMDDLPEVVALEADLQHRGREPDLLELLDRSRCARF